MSQKDISQLDKSLRSLGAASALKLPYITVIGQPSSGKSSLIRSLSGVRVPRDQGNTTRCPIEIRTTKSTQWHCQISIRPPGSPGSNVCEHPFGPPLSQTDDIELMILRAQMSILNPQVSVETCLGLTWAQVKRETPYPGLETNRHMFSHSVICVDSSAPTLQRMTFVDLPGILNSGETEQMDTLLTSYIQNPNSLILVAIAMNDDVTDQKARTLAKRFDPNGHRTIGVLTKPDMISSSGQFKTCQHWLDVLEGRKLPLKHGYYITRHPNEKELHQFVGNAEARRLEMCYFQNNSPWNASAIKENRVGSHKLEQAAGGILIDMMQTNLQEYKETARACLDQCNQDLAALPRSPSTDNLTMMISLVQSFSAEAINAVVGSPQYSESILQNKRLYHNLKIAIKRTAPIFRPWVNASEYLDAPRSRISLDLEEDESASDADELRICKLDANKIFYLGDIRKRIERANGLKGEISPSVQTSMVSEILTQWHQPTSDCLQAVCNAASGRLQALLSQHFDRFPNLREEVSKLLGDRAGECHTKTREFLDLVLEHEDGIFTQNNYYVDTFKDSWLKKYQSARGKIELEVAGHSIPTSPFGSPIRTTLFQTPLTPGPSPVRDGGLGKRVRVETEDSEYIPRPKKRSKDSYATELSIMADVRAYFQLMSLQFIDTIPRIINRSLLKGIASKLPELLQSLNSDVSKSQGHLEFLMKEDPVTTERRDMLLEKQKVFSVAYQEIVKFTI